MKTRKAFVSNSSSSSFMMHGGNIEEIAIHMLKTIIEDFSEYDREDDVDKIHARDYKRWKSNLKLALKRQDVKDGALGITMPSCNYDTYLVMNEDYLYITTCNNHAWGFSGINYEDYEEYTSIKNMVKSKMYFNVRNKLIHSYEHYDRNDENTKCPKCSEYYGSYVMNQAGERICASCFTGKLEMTKKMKETLRIEALQAKLKTNGIQNPITALDLED